MLTPFLSVPRRQKRLQKSLKKCLKIVPEHLELPTTYVLCLRQKSETSSKSKVETADEHYQFSKNFLLDRMIMLSNVSKRMKTCDPELTIF